MAKTLSPIVKTYLLFYNVILTLGWAYVGYLGLQKWNEPTRLWTQTEVPLKIFQTAAIMEIVHAILGFTPTNAATVGFQVLSRLGTVWGVLDLAPPARVSNGVPLLLICWVVTEVIRYSYYALHLLGSPGIIAWFRYSLFVILYPMGSTGEAWAMLDGLDYIKTHQLWSIGLPNSWNFTFNFHHILVGGLLLYIPIIFPMLYMHMFSQRRKVLGRRTGPARSHAE